MPNIFVDTRASSSPFHFCRVSTVMALTNNSENKAGELGDHCEKEQKIIKQL